MYECKAEHYLRAVHLYICSEEVDFSTFEGRVVLVVNVARY
jgi:glutathione peroxidase-family protein